jgi:hypothetical protein
MGGAQDRTAIKSFREAVESILPPARALVPFLGLAAADAKAIGDLAPGAPPWVEAATRLGLDEVIICKLHGAGLLAEITGQKYLADVSVFDRRGSRLQRFEVVVPNGVVDAPLKAKIAETLGP